MANILRKRIKDETELKRVKVGLAPSYGKLKQEYKHMDEALTVMIADSVNVPDEIRVQGEELDWSSVTSAFKQSTTMVHCEEDAVENYRQFNDRNVKFFSTKSRSSEPSEAVCREIEGWFNELINDKEVLDFTTLKGLREIKDIVARHGTTDKKRGSWSKDFLDIGILRFPDIENPYIRVYRIKLTAWAICEKKLRGLYEENRNGISGEYQSSTYRPREELIAQFSLEAKEMAKKRFESTFLSA